MACDADTKAGGCLRDGVGAQRARIVAFLCEQGRPVGCAELASACDVPSVTKRISELRADGCPIQTVIWQTFTRRGELRRATFYALIVDPQQPDLFTSERGAW